MIHRSIFRLKFNVKKAIDFPLSFQVFFGTVIKIYAFLSLVDILVSGCGGRESLFNTPRSWTKYSFNYRPQRSWAKVIFSQASVCPQGGSASLHAGMPPPRTRPPGSRHSPGPDPPPPGADTPPGADPPSQEADSSIWSMSGQYASHWNAFLFYGAFGKCQNVGLVLSVGEGGTRIPSRGGNPRGVGGMGANIQFCHIYRPKRSFGQGNIFTPVCHSVHRGGVSNFFGRVSNFGGSLIFQGVSNFFGGDVSGIRSTFGRYASYWNAFLFPIKLHQLRTFWAMQGERMPGAHPRSAIGSV